MTTVGFGDVTPISQAGRLTTVLMILTGIALIPWQLGDLIKQLVKTANQLETLCPTCIYPFMIPMLSYASSVVQSWKSLGVFKRLLASS
jgi:hypothetical protein